MEPRALEDEMKQVLAPLNHITLPRESEQKVRTNLQDAIQDYESGLKRFAGYKSRRRNRLFPAMSAAAFAIAAAGVTYYGLSNLVNGSKQPSTAAHDTGLSNIKYTKQTLQTIQGTATQSGVLMYLPHKVLPDGKVTVVKNGGKGSAILDFNRIWIIESSQPISPPQSQYISSKEFVTLPENNQSTFYKLKRNNDALYFKQGKTYIAIQHLRGQLPTKQQLIAIASSFKGVPNSTPKIVFGAAQYTHQQLSQVKSQTKQIGTALYVPHLSAKGDALISIQRGTGTFTSGKTVELKFRKFSLFESATHMSVPGGISSEKNVQIANDKSGRFAIAELKRTNGNIQSASLITFKQGNTFIQIRSRNGTVLPQKALVRIANSLYKVK
ncbi:hypothetical protein [Alicyclobacillus sp. SO9]|uniref:hypothetical protein n=1 Tax=Alicyclobacillus sp. SO9 TaxID=2665646 RepID=UPI0018E8EAE5|nr:hypothetical protein [Alicyclobacillus sp. SO9]QQE78792.1 hypothetical protein GI364_23600 [Alicyclobacillus sp. SO9]